MSSLVLLRSFPLPERFRHAIVIMGNFDGIHLGHQKLIQQAHSLAQQDPCPLLMLTFEPHPRQFFSPETADFRLTTLAMKFDHLSAYRIDALIALRFNETLASMSAEQFIKEILITQLQARHVLSGIDFRFGSARRGDDKMLAAQTAFRYHPLQSVLADDGKTRISSSGVRRYLRLGHIEEATSWLGRPWQWRGHVITGAKRGRNIGFATANMAVKPSLLLPQKGVYITQACVPSLRSGWLNAISHFGIRPTFGGTIPLLETHVLCSRPLHLYGRILYTRFIRFLRPERRFATITALQHQLDKDCTQARAFWQQQN